MTISLHPSGTVARTPTRIQVAGFHTSEQVAPDLRPLLDRAALMIMNGLNVDICHIYKLCSASSTLQLVAGVGWTDDASYGLALGPGHQSLEAYVLNERAPVVAEHLVHDDRFPMTPLAAQQNAASGLSVVIEGETAPFGVCSAYSRAPRAFSPADVELVQDVTRALTATFRDAHHARDRARLAAVATSMSEAVVELTMEGMIFGWNAAAEALYGYSSAEVAGQSASLLFPAGDASEPVATLDTLKRNGTIGPVETIIRRRDRTLVDVELRWAPITLPDRRVVAASMIARDLTQKRKADCDLQMHADILAHIPAAVVVWRLDDPDDASSLRLVLVNQRHGKADGVPADDQIGRRFGDVFRGADDPEPYAAVAGSGQARDFGERSVGVADRRRSFHLQAFPLPDRCVGVVWHDVTEKHALLDQLQHAQRMEVIGRLAGGVAHDFNNLLTVITGCSEFIRSRVEDETVLDDLRQIGHASRSAEQLARHLLECGRQHIVRPTNLDLASTVRTVRGLLGRLIGKHIQLMVLEADRPVVVRADAVQIERLLLNLAMNARDAMPEGGKIFIESSLTTIALDQVTRPELQPGTYGLLQITDTGTGIDAATLPRIFEPFFTTKEGRQGTGLGLSTVHDIASQCGGVVTVDSKPGEGTTFKVYIPAIKAITDEVSREPRVLPRLRGPRSAFVRS